MLKFPYVLWLKLKKNNPTTFQALQALIEIIDPHSSWSADFFVRYNFFYYLCRLIYKNLLNLIII